MIQHIVTVHGMTCSHCEKAVIDAIRKLDPQAQVRIERTQNRVEVDSELARETLLAAIEEEGYRVAA